MEGFRVLKVRESVVTPGATTLASKIDEGKAIVAMIR